MARRDNQQGGFPAIPKLLRIVLALVVAAGVYAYKNWIAPRFGWDRPQGQADRNTPAQTNTSREPARSSAPNPTPTRSPAAPSRRKDSAGDATLLRAIRDQSSDVTVQSEGVVKRVLADDIEGDRHQRFILTLATGDTILIAHNIDVAPRLPVQEGQSVTFKGQFEWNDQGGCVHWTHHDRAGRHPDGWLMLAGKKYD